MWRYFVPRKGERWWWLWLGHWWSVWYRVKRFARNNTPGPRGEGVWTHCHLLNCTHGWVMVTIKKEHIGRDFFFFSWKKEVSLRMGLDHKEQLIRSVYWWAKSGLLQVAQGQRICLPIQGTLETWVWSLEEEMATHSNILTVKTPWPEEPGGCSSWGSKATEHRSTAVECCNESIE